MNTSRRVFVAGALGAGLAPLVGSPARAQQKVEGRVAHVMQPVQEPHKVVTEVADKIRQRTEGRVNLKVFPAAQLGTTNEAIEQASIGEPMIAWTDASYLAQFGVPELSILGGPFIVGSNAEAAKLEGSALVQGWYEQLAKKANIRVLALNWIEGARHVVGKGLYPHPKDMKGVKIRVPPVPTWRRTFEPIGAIPTTVEAAEAYSALSQGVVDAAESPLTGIRGNRWQEPCPNITLTGHFILFTGWVFSEKVFQTMSKPDQAALVEEFRKGGEELTKRAEAAAGGIRADFEKAGVKFANADIAAYREATKSFYTGFPGWPEGLFDKVRAAATGA